MQHTCDAKGLAASHAARFLDSAYALGILQLHRREQLIRDISSLIAQLVKQRFASTRPRSRRKGTAHSRSYSNGPTRFGVHGASDVAKAIGRSLHHLLHPNSRTAFFNLHLFKRPPFPWPQITGSGWYASILLHGRRHYAPALANGIEMMFATPLDTHTANNEPQGGGLGKRS